MDDFTSKEIAEYKANEKRFATHEEFVEFSRNNFVFFQDDFGMRVQQLIETEEQFVNYLQRVCMIHHGAEWLMWLTNDPDVMAEYVTPTQQLVDRSDQRLEETGENPYTWGNEDAECYYRPDLEIEAWQADHNRFYDEPLEVHRTTVRVFQPGDLEVTEKYKAKMPFLARFVSHNTFDRCGSIKGTDLDIIPLKTLTNDVISIH